jgi:tetratricopeptide (TPR) repeat protein
MKRKALYLLVFMLAAPLVQAQTVATAGDYSPAVVAKDFHATYGVRADVVQAILNVYARKGLSPQARKARTEALIQSYSTTVSQGKGVLQLAPEDRERLGIATEPGLVAALNWDLFAKQHYLSTSGAYSPAIVAQGDVNIWFGIPEGALRTLAGRLEENEVELDQFSDRLSEMVAKYNELKKEMESYSEKDPVVREAEALLDAGKLEEAEALLEADYHASKKRLAYKAYLFGKTEELLLKYEQAEKYYGEAVRLDSVNVTYLFSLAGMYAAVSKLDMAQDALQKCLDLLDRDAIKDDSSRADVIYAMGGVWDRLGVIEKAIGFLRAAYELDSVVCGAVSWEVARDANAIGLALISKAEYDEALQSFKFGTKTLVSLPNQSPHDLATFWNNLGLAYYCLKNSDSALHYYEKSLEVFLHENNGANPNIGLIYSNIGRSFFLRFDFEQSVGYFERALQIDSVVWGVAHTRVANHYNGLGAAYRELHNYDESIKCFQRAISIDSTTFHGKHFGLAHSLEMMGWAYKMKGELDPANKYLKRALEMILEFRDLDHFMPQEILQRQVRIKVLRGQTAQKSEQWEIARRCFESGVATCDSILDKNFTMMCLSNLANLENRLGNYSNALGLIDSAFSLAEMMVTTYLSMNSGESGSTTTAEDSILALQAAINLKTYRRLKLGRITALRGLGELTCNRSVIAAMTEEAKTAGDGEFVTLMQEGGWVE